MSEIVLVAQVCMYNEVEKGNLNRCLDNLSRYCDHIVIYDDGSTDNSVEVARQYTPHIILGETNNQMQELAHKQVILEKSLELGATHLFWLDCDEVLDRKGTMGGLRSLCRNWPDGLDAFSFRELNLWRSQTYVRLDSLFTAAKFVRLWKVVPNIAFRVKIGVHMALYPSTIRKTQEAPFAVIHYGFWDYKRMMVKIGAHLMSQEQLEICSKENWILNETACSCYRLPDSEYPPGCMPPDYWPQPTPKPLSMLLTYDVVPPESQPLIDNRGQEEWTAKHEGNYHGDYQAILTRNKAAWETLEYSQMKRACLFRFDPAGKVVFDLGCGGGWFTVDCLKNGAIQVIGFDVSHKILDAAGTSFQELGVPKEFYRFYKIDDDLPELPKADIIFSMALFMHIPFWQSVRYFKWIVDNLKDGGSVYLQFYQSGNGYTMFFNGEDDVRTIRLENELDQAGLTIEEKYLADDEGLLPVWWFYRLSKKALPNEGQGNEI